MNSVIIGLPFFEDGRPIQSVILVDLGNDRLPIPVVP